MNKYKTFITHQATLWLQISVKHTRNKKNKRQAADIYNKKNTSLL